MTQLCRGWGIAARAPGGLSAMPTAAKFGITPRCDCGSPRAWRVRERPAQGLRPISGRLGRGSIRARRKDLAMSDDQVQAKLQAPGGRELPEAHRVRAVPVRCQREQAVLRQQPPVGPEGPPGPRTERVSALAAQLLPTATAFGSRARAVRGWVGPGGRSPGRISMGQSDVTLLGRSIHAKAIAPPP